MSVLNSQLGQVTQYPTHYDPSVLFPILRTDARQKYAHIPHIQQGMDWWHVFEISYLNADRIPQVAVGRLHIPADSPYLIESKSLKLYFNSLNFTVFTSQTHFIDTVEQDLSHASHSKIHLELFDVNQLTTQTPYGVCIDQVSPTTIEFHPNAQLLQLTSSTAPIVEEYVHSHLLRSNCPVTNQPDWGTIFIRYQGQEICKSSLLAYIISYREHNGFHEQCVEQIFADIWQMLNPEKLMVYAAYTRRGGLDINPCRTSEKDWLVQPLRLARQ